jgi:hypothetical protein
MAKEQAAKNLPPTSTTPLKNAPVIPAGLTRHTGDVLGFHDLEEQGPIHGIPRGAKISDSKLEPRKPSSFVIFELISDTTYTEGTGDEAEEKQAKKGDMVGVWTKGGMRPLRNLCDREVFMFYSGEKKLKGRPAAQSPMKTYDFHVGAGKPKLIPIIEDTREKSVGEKSMFDVKTKAGREPGEDIDEEVGF